MEFNVTYDLSTSTDGQIARTAERNQDTAKINSGHLGPNTDGTKEAAN